MIGFDGSIIHKSSCCPMMGYARFWKWRKPRMAKIMRAFEAVHLDMRAVIEDLGHNR
jgi:hypothetical protein